MSVPSGKILVIGLGNPDRGDDAVGSMVAKKLKKRLPADVTVVARSGDMLSLLDDWAGFDGVVCVDAAAPMGEPGRVHRIDLATDELPWELTFASSHTLGLAEALELAEVLGLAPPSIIVYAIEGGCFDDGAPVMPEVASAAEEVAGRIMAEIGRLRQSLTRVGSHHA